ncbi:hypothetical protein Tco_0351709 [Tanacetum coccineum]
MYHPHRASPPPNQFSSLSPFNLDDDDEFDLLWGSVSQPSQYTEGPSDTVEDDSPVEEVETVKLKRKYTRRRQPIKKNDKKIVEPWTPEEIRPKVSQFCEIYNSVKDRHQSGACDNTIYQEAEIEFRAIYHSAFALNECWKILKDHSKWKKVEIPNTYNSAHIGIYLNEEAADSDDVEVQVVRPMGRDKAKKKGSSSGARSESSVEGDPGLADALLSKFTMGATSFFRQGMNPPLSI